MECYLNYLEHVLIRFQEYMCHDDGRKKPEGEDFSVSTQERQHEASIEVEV